MLKNVFLLLPGIAGTALPERSGLQVWPLQVVPEATVREKRSLEGAWRSSRQDAADDAERRGAASPAPRGSDCSCTPAVRRAVEGPSRFGGAVRRRRRAQPA